MYNSVVYGNLYVHGAGINLNNGSAVLKNCAVFGNAGSDFDESASATIDYCASNDGTGTNAVAPSGSDWANEFADPANGDLTLLSTGNLYQAGVGPGADSDVPVTDIEGDSRSGVSCDIGADEYVSTGGGDSLAAQDTTTGAPELESPTITQVHALVAQDTATGAVVLESAAITQAHALTGQAIATGAPLLDTPSADATATEELTAVDVSVGAPVLETPELSQHHGLAAANINTGAAILEVAALTQRHTFTAVPIATAAAELEAPAVLQTHALAATTITLGAPVVGQAMIFEGIPREHLAGASRLRTTTTGVSAIRRGSAGACRITRTLAGTSRLT
jgi:hypothetical protein